MLLYLGQGSFTAVAKHVIRASGELRNLCSVESPKHFDGEAFPS